MSRWDGVVATSVNRLVAARPHSAANVEAPRPGHHREALRDLGKDHDPSEDINQLRRSSAWPAKHVSAAPAPSPQSGPAPTARALPPCRGRVRNVSLTTNRN
jgi:hypothetical protein